MCSFSLILGWRTLDPTNPRGIKENFPKREAAIAYVPFYYCCSFISVTINKIASIGSIFTSIFRGPVDKTQIEILQNKVTDLERQLSEEKAKNRRLEELYEVRTKLMRRYPSMDLIPANVIAVDPSEWFRYIIIDRGSNYGIHIDMPIITGSYINTTLPYLTGAIVGRVTDVYPNAAKVQLITDPMSVVAVTIKSLGDLVLMRGKPENESCGIDEIPSTAYDALTVGDLVTVDERSNIFPPGLLVGRISRIKREIEFCPIEVEPAFNFRKLREVMVVVMGG